MPFRPLVLATLLTLGLATPAMAAPGELDTGFGSGGGLALPAPGTAVASRADGSLFVLTGSQLLRLDGRGALLGASTVPGGAARAIALQSDGRIVVGGGDATLTVSRFNADGTIDRSFGGDGTVTGGAGAGRGVAIAPDGDIVVAGRGPNSSDSCGAAPGSVVVSRFNANGSSDAAFGTRTFFRGGCSSEANGVAVQPDGKVVLAGSSFSGPAGQNVTNGLVLRLTTSGGLDTSFNNDGEYDYFRAGSGFKSFFSVLVRNGAILLGGADNNPDPVAVFGRLTAAGNPDGAFGTGGFSLLPSARGFGASQAGARGLTIGAGERIVGAGNFVDSGQTDAGSWAVQAGGAPDTSFTSPLSRTLGFPATAIYGPPVSAAQGIATGRDGGFVIAGNASSASGGTLIKVQGFGTPPAGFLPPGAPKAPTTLQLTAGRIGLYHNINGINRGGQVIPLTCNRPCALRVSILLKLNKVKPLGFPRKSPHIGRSSIIGEARTTLFRAGTANVRVRLNAGSRKALAKQRRVEVGIRYEAKAGGTTKVIDRQLVLRR